MQHGHDKSPEASVVDETLHVKSYAPRLLLAWLMAIGWAKQQSKTTMFKIMCVLFLGMVYAKRLGQKTVPNNDVQILCSAAFLHGV